MPSSPPTILFHVGGPAFHPTAAQADEIVGWLGDGYRCRMVDGASAFDRLDDIDLLVVMGMHWTGMTADWTGNMTYTPLTDAQKAAFEDYVTSGRPLVVHHGGIINYDDWPRFTELIGFRWEWDVTHHPPFGEFDVAVLDTGHPIVAGIENYTIADELYCNVQLTPGLPAIRHAEAWGDGAQQPMVVTAEGGRAPGAGRVVYLANGHDMRAFVSPALRKLWINAVDWVMDGR